MKNELKIGSILSITSIIIGSLVQMFYTPMYMKYLGTTDYGINSLVQSIMGYIGMLNLGLGSAIVRYTVRYRTEGKIEEEKSLNGMFLIIFLIIMLISIILGIYIYFIIPELFTEKFTLEELIKTRKVFIITMVGTVVSFPVSVFSTNITSREKFLYQKTLNLLKLLITPIVGAILMLNGFKLIAIVSATIILTLITNLLDIIYAFKIGMRLKFNNFDFKILKDISVYSFYIFLNIVIDRIYWGTDRIIIGKYIGPIAVGIYSIASIFNMIYMNLSLAVSGVLFPRINKMVIERKYKELSDMFINIGRIQYILLGLISSGFIIFGNEFIYLWLGKGYVEVYKIALWIMIPLTIPLIQNTGMAIVQARNQHQFRSIVYFFIALLNIVMSILLVKKYGAIGCAVATGFSFIVGNIIIINIYYWKRANIDIPLFWKNILKMSIPVIITMIIGYGLNYFISDYKIMTFILKGIVYVGVYVALMWLLGMNKNEKKEILNPIKNIKGVKND
ncbi:oligosaccharide flippase family protein [uncultured Fusobacterium sp.]|uniref:oligosaccharide flippase family protein n=1 Tax=uncultured Fusobacterium sp. TaxID=159267 RepID=UPI0025FF3DC2|nr:oligosaccharide flippase family protein [uncultured Fusobacterium sp.]